MKSISITVITITRNNLLELQKTLESIFEQDYAHVDLVIVDGASTDGTPEFLRTLKNDKLKWLSEPDQGISDAYNKGIDLANGDLLLFLNSGDTFVNSQTLSQAVALIPNEVNLVESVVYGDYYQVFESECNLTRTDHRDLYSTCSLNHQSSFIGREISRRFRYDRRLLMDADYDLWLHLLLVKVPFIKINLPIARFYLTGVSSNLKYQVHIRMFRYFLMTLNTRKIMTVGDAIRVCFLALGSHLNVSLRKLVGRRVIRKLKDIVKL